MTTEQLNTSHDNLRRLQIPVQPVPKQKPAERVHNWDEAFLGYSLETAIIEAERCIHCPTAPCQDACPTGNNIPAALILLEEGDVFAAANKFRETSNLPDMCGRLCPQESLCEGACVVGFAIRPAPYGKQPPVSIGKLEAFIADYQRRNGGVPVPETAPPTGRKVAIVGSGPAGLAVAEELTKQGHTCVVFESWPVPGGILLYGIPNFKMREPLDIESKRVLVVGGGDTSMDCVRTAIRLRAASVTCMYRRTEAEQKGREEERKHAREEGVEFMYLTVPTKFGGEDGRVTAAECLRMQLGAPDDSGRRRPEPIPGSEFSLPVDVVVLAIGYEPDE